MTLTVEEWCGVNRHLERRGHDQQMVLAPVRALAAERPAREDYFAERRRIFESILPADPMNGVRELLALLRDA